jgi:hypothetical protein
MGKGKTINLNEYTPGEMQNVGCSKNVNDSGGN